MPEIKLVDVAMIYPFQKVSGIFNRKQQELILQQQKNMPYTSNEGVIALQHFTASFPDGDFVAVLGPSGSGKSTLLRVIAGLERPVAGDIYFDDRDYKFVPASERDCAMVFQNYSLYPNQTVYKNIAFPLEVKHTPREQIEPEVRIVGIPQIADVKALADILRILKVEVIEVADDHIIIDPTKMENVDLDDDIVTKLRASYYFMGALLGKYGYVRMKMPGGCYLGPRPIDLHLKGFEALGAKVTYDKACYTIQAKKLKGAKIFLDIASVGATINIMMASVYAEGRTTIENAAKEPEIIDIATLLNKMGARIRGAGTNVITIDGVKSLSGCFHEIIPDRIEAGTFIVIAAAMAKRMVINNIIPQHLDALLSKLKEMGVNMEVGIDKVVIERSESLKSVDITTRPYPGFATDLQQPLTALLTQANGEGRVTETIYIERFKHCIELNKMGADIDLIPAGAIIKGPTPLYGTKVSATDLRCGAAMIVAGLMAEGVTEIDNVYHIDRGYSEIDRKLSMLGAKIWRENVD